MDRIHRISSAAGTACRHPVDPVHPVKSSSSSGPVGKVIRVLHDSVPPCLCTANHSSLRVLREFQRPSSFESTPSAAHRTATETRRVTAAQALKSVQICEICVPILPWARHFPWGEFVHRLHRFAQIGCSANHAVRGGGEGGGPHDESSESGERRITGVAAMPRCVESLPTFLMHTPPLCVHLVRRSRFRPPHTQESNHERHEIHEKAGCRGGERLWEWGVAPVPRGCRMPVHGLPFSCVS